MISPILMKVWRNTRVLACGLALAPVLMAVQSSAQTNQPSVQVQPPNLHGSRPLEKVTNAAVLRDYLQSWKSFQAAMEQNRTDILSPDFVGIALEKLTATIGQQRKFELNTRYRDLSHDLQIVFYSPEGLSIQLIDNVVYDQQVFQHGNPLVSKKMRARYVVVLTPSQDRWQVRMFQASPE